ncbi:hypothetical protein LTR62_002812 [Meristemomyces frigidus]|uniref:Bromo domain-containing protein n=1 Tax=Meristemomyces frigidus TaxID=1508187 RepID=A0AAN7TIK4_9PEZI|nr:hypothetical protein LTR62_002812 [Meristemomyces frigidus]
MDFRRTIQDKSILKARMEILTRLEQKRQDDLVNLDHKHTNEVRALNEEHDMILANKQAEINQASPVLLELQELSFNYYAEEVSRGLTSKINTPEEDDSEYVETMDGAISDMASRTPESEAPYVPKTSRPRRVTKLTGNKRKNDNDGDQAEAADLPPLGAKRSRVDGPDEFPGLFWCYRGWGKHIRVTKEEWAVKSYQGQSSGGKKREAGADDEDGVRRETRRTAHTDAKGLPQAPGMRDLAFCHQLLDKLTSSRYHHITYHFFEAVDPVALGIPDYFDFIKDPMDLSTMRAKLEAKAYGKAEDFKADLDLMIRNCLKYNQKEEEVHSMGCELEKVVGFMWKTCTTPNQVEGVEGVQVDEITRHMIREDETVLYRVKWHGDEDETWEFASILEPSELEMYWESIGGEPSSATAPRWRGLRKKRNLRKTF